MPPAIEKRRAVDDDVIPATGKAVVADAETALMDGSSAAAEARRLPGSPASEQKSKTAMLIVTGCILLEFFRLALYQEVLGPTLPYLRSRTRSDYATVTQSISGKAVGAVLGGIAAGFMADKFQQGWSVVICVTQAVSAVWMAVMPFATHVGVYWAAFIIMGFLEGAVNIFAQEVVLRTWQANAAAPIHLLHFGFGCGAIVMPLIVSLFFPKVPSSGNDTATTVQRLNGSCVELVNGTLLPPPRLGLPSPQPTIGIAADASAAAAATVVSEHYAASTISDVVAESLPPALDDSLVQYAFILLASFGALCTAAFLCLIAAERRGCLALPRADETKPKPKLRDSVRLSSCLPHSRVKVALLLAAMFVFGALMAAVDRTFGSFIFVYAKQELCFADAAAVALNSAFWGAFTGGRMVGIVVAHRLHPKYFFLVVIAGLSTCCIALAIFGGGDHVLVTWIFSLGAAFFLGPSYPSFVAWSNRYITVTGMAFTLVLLGLAAGYVLCMTAVGHYLDEHAGAVSHFAAGFTAALLAVSAALQAIGSSLGDRFACSEREAAEGGKRDDEEMVALKANGTCENGS